MFVSNYICSLITYHLDSGQVLLPPQVLVILGPKCCQEVVAVHDDVDEGVQKTEESGVTAWGELHSKPHRHRHDTMMDYVQGGHMVVFLSQYEEELEK